jgi:hypothetical protein
VKYLVFCTCGHALDRHSPSAGCDGDNAPCGCRRDQQRALDSAIDEARTRPWGTWRPAEAEAEIA